MRERLRIGEVARLTGVTPKTVRHYEKIGLIKEADRSESGYRLYSAEDLLRVHRVKKLQSLGLSLKRVREVLGEEDGTAALRSVLEVLRAEVVGQIDRLEGRWKQIEAMLAREDLEAVEASPTFERAMEMYGDRLSGVSEAALEQEKRMWATLDAFDWPGGYDEANERFFRYFVDRPEEHQALISIGQRLSDLEEAPEDDPRVEAVAADLWRHFEEFPMPEEQIGDSVWSNETAVGEAMFGLLMSGYSPAQRRVMALIFEKAEGEEARDA